MIGRLISNEKNSFSSPTLKYFDSTYHGLFVCTVKKYSWKLRKTTSHKTFCKTNADQLRALTSVSALLLWFTLLSPSATRFADKPTVTQLN